MSPRTAKLLFVSGLSLGIASWLIDKTANEYYAERMKKLDALDSGNFRVETELRIGEILLAARSELAERRLDNIDWALQREQTPLNTRLLEANAAGWLQSIEDARVDFRETQKSCLHRGMGLLAPVAPEVTKEAEEALSRLVAEGERYVEMDRRAMAQGRAAHEKAGLEAAKVLERIMKETELIEQVYLDRVDAEKSKLERNNKVARWAYRLTYCLGGLLIVVGQWFKS